MNTRKIYRILSRLAWGVVSVFLFSCESIKEDMDGCRIYLEFIYDYNMEYTDSFDPQVNSVDIFVFDAQDKYMFTKQSSRKGLIGGKRMFLGDDLSFGQYKILTIGGLSESFWVSDERGNDLIPGQTMLEDIQISLVRESNIVSHEFPSLWIGVTQGVSYQSDMLILPVYLIKETNHFDLALVESGKDSKTQILSDRTPYTLEIVTPEGAVYGHDNTPRIKEPVTYLPYFTTVGEENEELLKAYINSNRLFYLDDFDYRLIVRSMKTGQPLWEYDLMNLLEHTKPALCPDGSPLSMQEYLDRQSEWHIVVLYKEEEPGGDQGGFVALKVVINDWIVWINNIEV